MELREPPRPEPHGRRPGAGWWIATVAAVVGAASLAVVMSQRFVLPPSGEDLEYLRQVSSKLKAAGALSESARVLDEYLSRHPEPSEERAKIAYSLGQTYLELGDTEKALRWFYEAESLDEGPLREELSRKIVHSLERLGRFHAAQAALDSRTRGGGEAEQDVRRPEDPVVARIGEEEILRSEVERAMDDLPPQLASSLDSAEARREFLRQYVAEELLWRKARKLEYDQDPEVRRQLELLWRQLAMSKFVEREVVSKITVDEADLRNFFSANVERYRRGDAEEPPTFEEVRRAVEADYRRQKVQTATDELLQSQLATAEVELFADRMSRDE